MILPVLQAGYLASQVPGLTLRWLSDDMLSEYGFPVLLAELYVVPSQLLLRRELVLAGSAG